MEAQWIEFHVDNWQKYNPTRHTASWLRLQVDWYQDPKVWELSHAGKLLFLYCLGLRAQGKKHMLVPLAAQCIGVSQDKIAQEMDILFKSGLLSKREAPITKVLRDETKRDDISAALDFEVIYQLYPKRPNQRKQFGLARLAKTVKTLDEYDQLKRAVANYAKHCEAECKEARFIKQFGTFTGEWREWVEMDPPLLKKGDWHG